MTYSSDVEFEGLLQDCLQQRSRAAEPGAGLEQRLMARLAQAAAEHSAEAVRRAAPRFGFAQSVQSRRSRTSLWVALTAHAAVILLLFTLAARRFQITTPKLAEIQLVAPPPLPPALKLSRMGGGGGQHDLTPAAQGHLPKFSEQQIVPPKAPPTIAPKLAVDPTVVVQKDLKLADNKMPELGLPNSTMHGVSMGDGEGTGIGSGRGSGIGPGVGGNMGGGPMHIGGTVHAPALIYQPDAEFSEEARKAKFSGNVLVYLWVDEHGNPSHIRVTRGVGMGLDEKAVEAVRQYKFKPALKDGKPVAVDMTIDVGFQIY